MVEKSCIHPFIQKTQRAFQKGSTIGNAIGTIKDYQQRVSRKIKNVNPEVKLLHIIGTSTIFLGGIVLYEYARAHGAPFTDSLDIIHGVLPAASISPDDEYFDTDTSVWRHGKDEGLEGEELRKKVDEHRKAGHGVYDKYLEAGMMTPEEAGKARRDWDKKHGYRR